MYSSVPQIVILPLLDTCQIQKTVATRLQQETFLHQTLRSVLRLAAIQDLMSDFFTTVMLGSTLW